MLIKKGDPKTGGRAKGTPNKATADVRATIALIAERNVERLETWLGEVADKDPGKAADLFLRMIEYHIPKQARLAIGGAADLPPLAIVDFSAEVIALAARRMLQASAIEAAS